MKAIVYTPPKRWRCSRCHVSLSELVHSKSRRVGLCTGCYADSLPRPGSLPPCQGPPWCPCHGWAMPSCIMVQLSRSVE